MTKTLTQRENFTLIRAAIDTHPNVPQVAKDAMLAFIDGRVEVLTRKRASGTVDAAKVAAQKVVKDSILAVLPESDAEGVRATDIASSIGTSVQKVTSMLKKMVEDDKTVTRHEDKKVTTFTLA